MTEKLYGSYTEILTTDGFKSIKNLDGDEKLVILNSNNEFEVIEDYEIINETGFVGKYGVNKRCVIGTEEAARESFYSLDYNFNGSLDNSMIINVDDKDYKVSVREYIIFGFVLFNHFTYNEVNGLYEFNASSMGKYNNGIKMELGRLFNLFNRSLCEKIVLYEEQGDIITIKTDTFPDGINSYIRFLVKCLLNRTPVLTALYDLEFVYEMCRVQSYNEIQKTFFMNLRNLELAKIFCVFYNMSFNGGLLEDKKFKYLLYNVVVPSYKDDRKSIQSFMYENTYRSNGGYGIKIGTKDCFLPSIVNSGSVYYNFSFIPTSD